MVGIAKPLRTAAILTGSTLVLLEVVLQLLYVGFWWFSPRVDNTIASGERVILCVGDSYTFGEGKSAPRFSYPAQLEAILRQEVREEWRVVNYGWPGRNSRTMLERLDAQLAQCRPEFVYAIIGTNDKWATPAELTLAEAPAASAETTAHEPFRLEYRTARLFRIFQVLWPFEMRGGSSVDDALVGRWAGDDGQVYQLAADGSATIGGAVVTWRCAGARLEFCQAGHVIVGADYSIAADELRLAADGGRSLRLRRLPGAPTESRAASEESTAWAKAKIGTSALQAGDYRTADRAFREVLEIAAPGSDLELSTHYDRLRVALNTGDDPRLAAELEWLEDECRRRPRELAASLWLQGLKGSGQIEAGCRHGARFVREYPSSADLWHLYAALAYEGNDLPQARSAIDRCIELTRAKGESRAGRWHLRSRIYATLDAGEAMRSAVLGYCTERDVARARVSMLALRARVDRASLQRILQRESVADADREVLLALHRDPATFGGDPAEVYRSHLRQLVQRCRASGAQPVLATYPFGAPFEEVSRAVAATHGAGFVALHSEFAKVRQRNPDTEYFISDGHCNDAGYGVMARILADDVRARRRDR